MAIQKTPLNNRTPILVWIIASIFFPVTSGLVSISLGQQFNWDLLSYHYYNGYAFLENRLGFDIAPAGIQSFLNPALDVLFYWMVHNAHPKLIIFVLGFIQGFNLTIIFLIYWRAASILNKWFKLSIGICTTLIALIAPGFLGELGTTYWDNIVSLFMLSGILLLLSAFKNTGSQEHQGVGLRIIAAGAVMGLGVGLKPIIIPFAVGTAIVLLSLTNSWRRKATYLALYGTFGILGGLISNGFWLWKLWINLGNPLFPYFNNIFKSPYISPDWYSFIYYSDYSPRNFWEYLVWPFIFSLDAKRVNENWFFDIRFGLIYLLGLGWGIRSIFTRFQPKTEDRIFYPQQANFLLAFFWLGFLLWMVMFSYYRFLIPLELLVPIVLLMLLECITNSNKTRFVSAIFLFLMIIFTFSPLRVGSTAWSNRYFEIDTSAFTPANNAIVVMLGPSPMGYVIPEAPPEIRFVRPDWNYVTQNQQGRYYLEIEQLLINHGGPLFVLYNRDDSGIINIDNSLNRFHLSMTPNECVLLKHNVPDSLMLCKLSRHQ